MASTQIRGSNIEHFLVSVLKSFEKWDENSFKSSNIVDFSCPHLLLVLKESNSSTILSLAAGYKSLPFDGHKELVLLYGENRIFIEHDRNIVFNNNSISLPYEHEGISIQRDLNSIEITVKTSNKVKLLALNCEIEKDICIVEVNGWLYHDTFGLFGNFDNDPYNDFVLPDGSSVTNSEVWEDSWMTDQNCSKIVTGISYLKEPSQRALKFCSRMFLDNNSPAVPCHGSVNIHPYYVNCLNAQRALDYPTRKARTTQYFPKEHDKITEEKEHENNTSQLIYEDYDNNYKNVSDEEYNYLDENFFYWHHNTNDSQTQMRVKRSFENSFWKPTREHDIKISLHDISPEETRALCNVFSAYTKTCSSKSVNLILPLECDFSYLNHDDDPVHHSLSIDLLILYEEAECSTFVYESVVSVIHENIIDLLNS
ncbi:Apolipophorin, partial [Armadillidium nasatum]